MLFSLFYNLSTYAFEVKFQRLLPTSNMTKRNRNMTNFRVPKLLKLKQLCKDVYDMENYLFQNRMIS